MLNRRCRATKPIKPPRPRSKPASESALGKAAPCLTRALARKPGEASGGLPFCCGFEGSMSAWRRTAARARSAVEPASPPGFGFDSERLVPNAPKGWEQPPNQNKSRSQSTPKALEPRGPPSNAGPLRDGRGLTFEMQSGNDSRPTVVHILHMSRWQAPVTMGQAQTSW